jgi:aldose 1-epimerase
VCQGGGMVEPTGEQFEISGGGYRAVVAEGGAVLRLLEYAGRPLLDGVPDGAMPSGARGQLLMPWVNRIRDGAYEFGGTSYQLALSEPARHNASHGLVRWAGWTVEEHTDHSVSLVLRLMAQTGYPWTLDLHVLYDLSADGLTVSQTATNLAATAAPYACGAHPYLALGDGLIDDLELTLPAATRLLTDDERKLPVGREAVSDTAYDFRVSRPVRDTVFDHAFTDLTRDGSGRASVVLRERASDHGVLLWVDGRYPWLQVFSGEGSATPRRSLAVEPMTSPPDAFNSGADLPVLAPAGERGDELSGSWGVRALE